MTTNGLDLIASPEAAEMLGLTLRTFNRRVASGVAVPAMTLPGGKGRHLFHRADIEALRIELTTPALKAVDAA